MIDALRYVCIGLWASSTMITVAVLLTYIEATRKTPGIVRLLFGHVAMVTVSHLVATSALTHLVASKLGDEEPSVYMAPTLLSLVFSNAALFLVLRYQRARKHRVLTQGEHDASA